MYVVRVIKLPDVQYPRVVEREFVARNDSRFRIQKNLAQRYDHLYDRDLGDLDGWTIQLRGLADLVRVAWFKDMKAEALESLNSAKS